MNIGQRLMAPTPPFFQKIRTIGLVLTAISAAVIGLPVVLPAIITQVAGYVALAGAVMTGVSQATVENEGG
jgi:hypothetical protein